VKRVQEAIVSAERREHVQEEEGSMTEPAKSEEIELDDLAGQTGKAKGATRK